MWVDKEEREDGFSLVELLVVIVIIGILSSIAIAAFLNQRQKAIDATVEAEMRRSIVAIETMLVDNPNAAYFSSQYSFFYKKGTVGTTSNQPLDDEEGWHTADERSGRQIFRLHSEDKKVIAEESVSIIDKEGNRTDGDVRIYGLNGYDNLDNGYTLYGHHKNSYKYNMDKAKTEEEMRQTPQYKAFEEYHNVLSEKPASEWTAEENDEYNRLLLEVLKDALSGREALFYDSSTGKTEHMSFDEGREKYEE